MGCKTFNTPIALKPVDGYFTAMKPITAIACEMNEINFISNFNPAPTMNKLPTIIDFGKETLCIIILPKTAHDMDIKINKSYTKSNVLHVEYSISKGSEERSFTIIPVKIFTFDKSPQIKSVKFKNISE